MKKQVVAAPKELRSWKAIAQHLNKPVATVQRWAREGMPVRREGRFVVALPDDLSKWFGEQGQPVHIVGPGEDLTAELRRAVSTARKQHSK